MDWVCVCAASFLYIENVAGYYLLLCVYLVSWLFAISLVFFSTSFSSFLMQCICKLKLASVKNDEDHLYVCVRVRAKWIHCVEREKYEVNIDIDTDIDMFISWFYFILLFQFIYFALYAYVDLCIKLMDGNFNKSVYFVC